MSKNGNGGTKRNIYLALVVIVALAVVGVVFSPDNTISILGFCGIAVTGLFTHLSTLNTAEKAQQAAEQVEKRVIVAAQKVEEVKAALVEKDENMDVRLDGIVKMGVRNHVLLNSNMGIQLKSNAALSRWKADQTGKPEDKAAADEAQDMYEEHQRKQTQLDAQDARDAK